LSLVAGVAIAKALRAFGVLRASLKWPNDLVVGDAKLGGILVETRNHDRASLAVVGIGLNCHRDSSLERRLRRRCAFLEDYLDPFPSRNRIIQQTTSALLEALAAFEARGFDALRADWLALHAHTGHKLRVRLADGRMVTGIATGLADDGGLRLRTRGGERAIRSGRVISARTA